MEITKEEREQIAIFNEGTFLKVVINNPKKKNALNTKHLLILLEAMEKAKQDENIRAVYVTAEGDFFTSGNDFNNFTMMTKDQMVENFKNFMNYLIDYPKLLVAGINGPCIGMGFTMLVHFDIVLCSTNAMFLVPFIQTLQVPEGTSSYIFPRLFGKLAGQILYKGDPITSEEAKNSGLVAKVFDAEDFKVNSLDYVKDLCKHPTRLLTLYKQMITKYDKNIMKEVNSYECQELRKSWDHQDFSNIMKKFTKSKTSKAKF